MYWRRFIFDVSYFVVLYQITLRGQGGSRVKKIFILIMWYVVALCFLFPKWAHLPSNSKRLKFYGPKREGRFTRFSQNFPTFFLKNRHFFENFFLTSFPVFDPATQFFGYGWPSRIQKHVRKRIFEILIFFWFFGHFVVKKSRFVINFVIKWPKNPKKIKISKICFLTFFCILVGYP